MLVRVSGGNSGIADYLENGIKNGREFTRDELDQRVTLVGDLALTDKIIQNIEDKGQDRYLHITLSFRESDVSRETLEAVTHEYKSILMSAYGEDEYCFYAEAHLPKIKSIEDRKSGKMLERKPHIHIVIPERNLMTGKYLRPVGLYTQNVKYFDAIQEHINNKYKLDSPKDFVRQDDEQHAQMLSRIKGDIYREKHGEFKRELFHQIGYQDIRSVESFQALLTQHGDVVLRNAGKPDAYFAVKLPGDSKFTNLKAAVFRPAYIEQRQLLLDKPSPKQIADRLETWTTIASREIKYISNASAKVKAAYKAASLGERRGILDQKEHDYEQRYRTAGRADHHQPRAEFATRGRSTGLRTGLPSLSERHVVHRAWGKRQGAESILPDYAHRTVDDLRADQHHGLRRYGYGERIGIGRANVLSQLMADAGEGIVVQQELAQFAEIRRRLDPKLLLADLAKRYAITPSSYAIHRAKDGSPRLQVGNQRLNVSDFLTKHMNLPWAEAKEVLLDCYAKQQAKRAYRQPSAWAESWAQFKTDRQAVFSTKMTWSQRQVALSIAIFERLKREELLREGALLPATQEKQMDAAVKERVENRLSPEVTANSFSLQAKLAQRQREESFERDKEAHLKMNDLIADKSVAGEVRYKTRDGESAFTDKGDSLVFHKKDMSADKLALGLELAIARYGQSLRLEGSEAFKLQMVNAAVERGIEVEFKPAEWQKLYLARCAELAQNRPEQGEGSLVPDRSVEATAKREAAIQRIRDQMDAYGKPVANATANSPHPAVTTSTANAAEKTPDVPGAILIAHGAAPYQHDQNQKDSYFVTTRDHQGREQTVWGVDLQRAVAESGAQAGDTVVLRNLGRQPVTVEEPERNEQGEVIGYRSVQTHRNTWEVERQPEQQNNKSIDQEKRAEAVLSLWQEALKLKESDQLQAKSKLVDAMQQAKALGQECAAAGQEMPTTMKVEPALADAWRDGHQEQQQIEQGHDHGQ